MRLRLLELGMALVVLFYIALLFVPLAANLGILP